MSTILAKGRFPGSSVAKHFLSLAEIDAGELRGIIDMARAMKNRRIGWPKGRRDHERTLDGHVVALVFEKASTRTRVSFDVAVRQLGGDVVTLSAAEMQLGRGETIADTARVLSRYVDAVMLRARDHSDIEVLASHASIPIINGLTDRAHPCQLMADVLTLEEHLGEINGKTVAWLGDANNVANSAIAAAVKFGFHLRLACPAAFAPRQDLLDWAAKSGGRITVTDNAVEAVDGAHAVMTDTWISMGDEADRETRLKAFAKFQVNASLMEKAAANAVFLHCLPAHRGEEVTAEVIDGPHSLVWQQAENRLHAQKAVLRWCLNV